MENEQVLKAIDDVKKAVQELGLNPVHLIAVSFLLDDLKLKLIGGENEDRSD